MVTDGAQALDYLYKRGNYQARADGNPAVVPDLKMPKVMDSRSCDIKQDAQLKNVPVVMLTSSREEPTSSGATASA